MKIKCHAEFPGKQPMYRRWERRVNSSQELCGRVRLRDKGAREVGTLMVLWSFLLFSNCST